MSGWNDAVMFRKIHIAPRLCLLAMLSLLAGCMSEREMYTRIQSYRADAFQEWQRNKEEKKEVEPILEGELSLEDALKLAFNYNKSLQAAIQEIDIAQGRIREADSGQLPTLSAVADYTRLDKVGSMNIGGVSISMGNVNNYSAGLEVRQPLFRGGAIEAEKRAARWSALMAHEQVRETAQQVVYDVAKSYYDVLLGQHLYQVNRDAVESAKAHLRDVQAKRNQGIASDFDILRAQVDVSNFEAAMIQQRNRIHVNRTILNRTMGTSQESRTTLTDELTYLPVMPVFDEAVRLAYQNRSDLYRSELTLQLQEETLRMAESAYWPRADAWLREVWSNPDPHASTKSRWGNAWSGGIALNWTLFNGFAREGRLTQEKARLEKRAIELLDTEERVLQQLQRAIYSLYDAEEFIESQRMNLERAKEAFRLVEVEYRQGISDAVQVTEARAALTRARGFYYQAIFDHTIARLDLQRAMGILGPQAGETHESMIDTPVRPGELQPFSIKTGNFPAESSGVVPSPTSETPDNKEGRQ